VLGGKLEKDAHALVGAVTVEALFRARGRARPRSLAPASEVGITVMDFRSRM
jgi:hypothetical protein